MARAICDLDMGRVYIGVASYLPRREEMAAMASRVAAG